MKGKLYWLGGAVLAAAATAALLKGAAEANDSYFCTEYFCEAAATFRLIGLGLVAVLVVYSVTGALSATRRRDR